MGVIERFLSESVSSQKQRAAAPIVYGEGEHAVQPVREALAPFGKSVHQHFGVGVVGPETIPLRLKLPAQLEVIVDFAVEHDADAAVRVKHRLMAAFNRDDRETPVPQK